MRIKLLSADIASKIAAGEVVERPASVVKELLENSIDAQATQIDLTVQRGGIQLIEVRDNGCGIVKEDLLLAVTQHATSKINSVADLEGINSLGFRGEALASINAVANLSIISKTQDQEQAWSIVNDALSVAAHPVGTTIRMSDLFYNLPARRKFLRSENTEYQHLEEVFRRIALSNFTVGFSLKSHDKLLKKLPICMDEAARVRRLVNLCGQQIIDKAISIDAEQNGLRLWGWLGAPQAARSQEQHQYFFINKRIIRDRLINHAIRQVYQPLCQDGKMPFYCLYLELDPVALDVNVHPTKHEVRFRDARVIHAFLTQVLSEALGTTKASTVGYTHDNYLNNLQSTITNKSTSEIMAIFADRIILANRQQKLLLIDGLEARKQLLMQQLINNTGAAILTQPQTANLPVALDFKQEFANWCVKFGIELDQVGQSKVLIRALPNILQAENLDLNLLLTSLYSLWLKKSDNSEVYTAIVNAVNFTDALSVGRSQNLLDNIHTLKPQQVWREFDIDELHNLLRKL